MFVNDRQRRAMFAKMNEKKDTVGSAESTVDVPDWVTTPIKPPEPVQTVAPSGADYLVEYAKTIKPSDTGIQIQGDKSDVGKQVDDMLAKYGRNLPKEKKLVGAVKVDDEYKDGPMRLIVRNKVKPELDELLHAHLSRNPDWVDVKRSDGGYALSVGDKTIDVSDQEDIKYIDDMLQTRLKLRLDKEGVLSESDLTNFRVNLLKQKFGL